MHTNARLISSLMISTALISLAAPAHAVDALETPTGGNVVAGSATITSPGAGQLTVNQGSDRAVIDWNSFNIGKDATTEFVQPGQNSLAVNRVTGAGTDPTQILGTLRANGRVMVLDRNGVIFGKQARVDVGGIVASTGDVSNAQVMSGADRIELTQNGSTGAVENHGTITVADGGLAALVAPTVRNNGTINARLGRVGLASGDKVTVDLYGDNLIEMEVAGTAQKALVENAGVINAEAGLIQISTSTAKNVVDNVINLDGVTNVSSVSQQGGRIVLSGGDVNVRGTVNASGRTGGSVNVAARNITTARTASISANAAAGQAAGRVDLVATNNGSFDGSISAVGAKGTGFVDTSAANVSFGNNLRVAATDEWLIDPTNLAIDAASVAALANQLNFSGNVTLTTPAAGADAGNITVSALLTWNSINSLTLTAINNIAIVAGGGLQSQGAGNITLNAGRDITVGGSGISTNTGNIRFNNHNGNILVTSNITSQGGSIVTDTRRFRLNSGEVNANGGNVQIHNWGGFQATANSIKTTGTGYISVQQNKATGDAFFSVNSIQNIVNAVRHSGTGEARVSIGVGTWNENVTIDRNLMLLGRNAGLTGYGTRNTETVISAAGTAVTVKADNVQVNGFKFDGGNTAVRSSGYNNVVVSNNIITNTKSDAVFIENGTGGRVSRNLITNSGKNGVMLNHMDNMYAINNHINNTAGSAINANRSNGLTATGNIIHSAGSYGIYAGGGNAFNISNNYLGYTDAGVTLAGSAAKGAGIHVSDSVNTSLSHSVVQNNTIANVTGITAFNGHGIQVFNSQYVDIGGAGAGNTITGVAANGVQLANSGFMTVTGNTITNSKSGIGASTSNNVTIAGNTIGGTTAVYGINVTTTSDASVTGNTVGATGSDGILGDTTTNMVIDGNTVTGAGTNGIRSHNGRNTVLANNTVTNAAGTGIRVHGNQTTGVLVEGNTITDAPLGMYFDDGEIDLSGTTNTINGGNVGMRFRGTQPSLVGNTIGTTVFNGQGTYYVELLDGALFAPGTPTIIDGVGATYDGLNPALTGGVLTLAELTALQDKIWDFNDDGTLGLFFAGAVPLPPAALTFADEDAFNTFSTFAPAAGRVGLTIAGLPRVPGTPAPAAAPQAPNDITNPDVLNTLAPAAGGTPAEGTEQQPTAEQVASIAPAAGGSQSASCWSDATSIASNGTTVNYDFGTDATAALADAANCNTTAP